MKGEMLVPEGLLSRGMLILLLLPCVAFIVCHYR